MPEVAEVRLIADNLSSFLSGCYLTQLRVLNPSVVCKWVARCCPGIAEFNKLLDEKGPLLILSVHTQGKFCWLNSADDISIGISFGMSGNIRPEPTDDFMKQYRWKGKVITKEEYMKHCHIAFEFLSAATAIDVNDSDSVSIGKIKTIYYHDVRRFGRFDFFYSKAELQKKLQKLGHDPLSEAPLDELVVLQKFRFYNHQNICRVLMEQEMFAGVGNFIKSETLYEARISPYAMVKDIADEHLIALYNAIKNIAKEAYESGGAALYTFTGMNGDQSCFKDTLKVYGHEGKKDANGYVIQRIPDTLSPDRRSTFWVPEIQIIGQSQIQKKCDDDVKLTAVVETLENTRVRTLKPLKLPSTFRRMPNQTQNN
jgi:formamidopyrimidine-DNA glycosylase